jgi:hypothetical protein
MDNKKSLKNPTKVYECINCDYYTSSAKDFKKHLLTAKHRRIMMDNKKSLKKRHIFVCSCGKQYEYSSGLSKHKKKCILLNKEEIKNEIKGEIKDEIKNEIIEFNKESKHSALYKEVLPFVKEMIVDIVPVLRPNQYNINMFLNEQCKDAMNITDFIESIQLSLEDMMNIGVQGQTKGMSNILIENLNKLDVVKRPVHCSDIKKEIIYVKDEDKWEKEGNDKPKLKNALDQLTKKSLHAIPCMEEDPDSYVKTISEVMKDPREDKKIISNLAKEVIVDK